MTRFVRMLMFLVLAVLIGAPFALAQGRDRDRNRDRDRGERRDEVRRDDRRDRGERRDEVRRDIRRDRRDYREYNRSHKWHARPGRHRFPLRYEGYGRYFERRYYGQRIGPHSLIRVHYRGRLIRAYWPWYEAPVCGEMSQVALERYRVDGYHFDYERFIMARVACPR